MVLLQLGIRKKRARRQFLQFSPQQMFPCVVRMKVLPLVLELSAKYSRTKLNQVGMGVASTCIGSELEFVSKWNLRKTEVHSN